MKSEMSDKLIVIGLDGVPQRVLERTIKKGVTPNLAHIQEKGCHGVLKSTIPYSTPSAWASIQTGVNPGKHGVYGFIFPKNIKTDFSTALASDIKSKTFLECLEENGLKAIFINMPLSHPPKTDFITVGSMFSPTKVYPRETEEKYDFSKYNLFKTPGAKPIENAYSNLHHLKNNMPLVKKLFLEEDWDLFFYLFSQTDWVLHDCGTDFFEDRDTERAKAVYDVYKAVDEYIGWFLEHRRDANILLLSDHGFQYYPRRVYYPVILAEHNIMQKIKVASMFPIGNLWDKNNTFLFNIQKILIRMALHSKYVYKKLSSSRPWIVDINLSQNQKDSLLTTASGNHMDLYVNDSRFFNLVKDEEKNELIQRTIKILRKYDDYIHVMRGNEVYWGRETKNAPDILLLPKKAIPWAALGLNWLIEKPLVTHSIDGIIMGFGPDIANRELAVGPLYDIAPTILHYFGLPVPEDIDGKVMHDIFREGTALRKQKADVDKSGEIGRIKDGIKGLKIQGA